MDMLQYAGLWLLIALAFNMWGWLSVLGSDARIGSKAVWTVVLVLLPGAGFVIWFLAGPRSRRA